SGWGRWARVPCCRSYSTDWRAGATAGCCDCCRRWPLWARSPGPSRSAGASSRRARFRLKTRPPPSSFPATEASVGGRYHQPMRQLDLNADVGEGYPDADAALLRLVTSANVACGLHAGDPQTMRATVAMAIEQGVAVGAHPGYEDREGFGRRPMQLSAADVNGLILYQLGALDAVARAAGAIL